ncbi:MAG: glycosyltransferase [Clostridium sp.]|nr:glycosyltransferase [Clostridium sp.]
MDIMELKEKIINLFRQGTISPDDNEMLIKMAKSQEMSVRKEIADAILREEGSSITTNIWLYSFAIAVCPNEMMMKNLIMMVKMAYELDYKQKYFLFQQINSIIFQYPVCNTEDIVRMAWGLLEDILRACKEQLNIPLKKIAASELNKGISIVLVEQYLTAEHGPTKTALDRCYVLKKRFGQDVMLVNTAELLSPANCIYFENASIGNYIPEFSTQDHVSWQGETFRFYQCAQTMPDEDGILELISFVQAIKPASIVLVGGTSLIAGLLNEFVPVITVGTIQSGLAMTLADYQVIDQNMLEKSYALLERMGKSGEHIIPGKFTFSLKPQTQTITRASIGIEDDAFALAVVGGRLKEEITDEFLCMLEQCVEKTPQNKKLQVGIVGGCADFAEKMSRHPALTGHVVNVGFAKDILSVVEQFDLYVNPIRRGGGTSVVEAMSKGLPVVTVDYGDVAGIVGEDFCCKDYEAMQREILAYMTDTDKYNAMSVRATELAGEYLDSGKEFARIMQLYYRNTGVLPTYKPVLSVIVPCYNVEAYVERCIQSILHQTIGLDKMEILLVNDASTDHTLDILKNYEKQYPQNIHVIDLEQNAGLSHARNVGIKHASTEYIAFVDSDDWIQPEMYEDLYVNGIAQGCDLAMCGFKRCVEYPDRQIQSEEAERGIVAIQGEDIRSIVLGEYRTNVYAWNKIYKKSDFIKWEIFYPEGLCYEDNYVGFLMMLVCKKIYITEKKYYCWFKNTGSITGQNKNILDRIQVQKYLLEKTKRMGFYEPFADIIDYNFFEKVFVECFIAYGNKGLISLEKIQDLKDTVLEFVPEIRKNPYYIGKREIDHITIARQIGKLLEEEITQTSVDKVLRECTND